MTDYNEEYYIAMLPEGDDVIFPKYQKKSVLRKIGEEKLLLDDGPMFYENSFREEDRKLGVQRDSLPDILTVFSDLVVPPVLKEYLERFPIYGLQFFPAVYVDDYDQWHEDYWALNFYKRIAALDIDNCEIDWELSKPSKNRYTVERFSLSSKVIDEIPEETRMVFKIGQSRKSYIMVHQKIKDFIDQAGFTGVRFIKVSEFEEGSQFRG